LVEHDCNCEIDQEVGADNDAADEEDYRGQLVVAIFDHVHDVGPAFECCALEYGKICRSQVIKISDAIVENGEQAISIQIGVWIQLKCLHFPILIFHG